MNDVNAADDGLIIYHEYTHGLTNRLVTDAGGFPALNGAQPGAMDEGFADWYALDFLTAQGFETDTAAPGELKAGRYENDTLRSQAWDCPVGAAASACPGPAPAGSGGYTYGDFGRISGGAEVHADGEIWVETLWDLRTRMIAAHGLTTGINRTRALVTDGLRLAPGQPDLPQHARRDPAGEHQPRLRRQRAPLVRLRRARHGLPRAHDGQQRHGAGPGLLAPSADVDTPAADAGQDEAEDHPRVHEAQALQGRRPQRVHFTLSEISTVEIAISRAVTGRRSKGRCRRATRKLRKRPRCTRYVAAGSLVRINMSAGAHSVGFAGKLRGRALKTGAYKATIRATDPSGNHSRANDHELPHRPSLSAWRIGSAQQRGHDPITSPSWRTTARSPTRSSTSERAHGPAGWPPPGWARGTACGSRIRRGSPSSSCCTRCRASAPSWRPSRRLIHRSPSRARRPRSARTRRCAAPSSRTRSTP